MDRQVAEAKLGQVLCGKYTLDRVLGVGGMATVYRASHRNGHKAAVKILHPHLAAYGGIRERFVKEAYTANRLEHAGAVSITDDDVAEDGSAFLVMELLDGETLDSWSERCGPALPPAEVARAMHEVLDVLVAAHRHGVIHRDLKPENIFRNRDGRIKVLDFGIARAIFDSAPSQTRTGSLLGTPAYMPPEQACGRIREIDGRTDLWAVGATAFSLFTGRTVHTQDTVEMLHVAAATQPAPAITAVLASVPGEIAAVFDRALAFDKLGRWENAREMQAALEDAYMTAFGESLVSREQAALQATLLPESRRAQPVASAETMPPSLGPASALPNLQRSTAPASPASVSQPLASPPAPRPAAAVGASTTGALVSERGALATSEVPPATPSAAPPSRSRVVPGVVAALVALLVAGGAAKALSASAPAPAAASPVVAAASPVVATASPVAPATSPVATVATATATVQEPPAPPPSPLPTPHPLEPIKKVPVTAGGPGKKPDGKAATPVAPAAAAPAAAAPAAAPASAAPKPNCNPPYTVKDGIEVMKPECAHR